MKTARNIILLLLPILLANCSSLQPAPDNTRYFDENNNEISKTEFRKIRATNELLDIPGDSANHRKLTLRESQGRITDRPALVSFLEERTGQPINPEAPLVIVYYPGKDPCNSTGSASKRSRRKWYEELEEGIEQIAQTKPIYVYKNNEGLNDLDGMLAWHKDPEGTIERLFFKHHYPCSSFVVISEEGEYIAYYGEFPQKFVWRATEILTE